MLVYFFTISVVCLFFSPLASGQTYCKSGANLDFLGLDRLTAKHVVAAGGNYWIMKDIITDDPTTCYGVATQAVDELT